MTRDVGQRQVNVETKLNNVESTFSVSMLILPTLEKVETTLSFSRSCFATLTNVESALRILPHVKS